MRKLVVQGAVVLVALFAYARPSTGADERPGYLAALAGEYAVIGRQPVGPEDGREVAGRRAYAGTADVEVRGREVRVRRTIDGVETRLVGGLEPALDGDAEVLRLRVAGAPDGLTFTCLERGDLDNYLRLTCVWTEGAEARPREPGLEAWFPTGAWAIDAGGAGR